MAHGMECYLPHGTNFRIVCFQLRNPPGPGTPANPSPYIAAPSAPSGRAQSASVSDHWIRRTFPRQICDASRSCTARNSYVATIPGPGQPSRAGTPCCAKNDRISITSNPPRRRQAHAGRPTHGCGLQLPPGAPARTAQTHGTHRASHSPMTIPVAHSTP